MPDEKTFGKAIGKHFVIVARFYAEAGFFVKFTDKLKRRL